ncbi:MAG: YbhB/YbcL family Raf kinase inhibitor-like protein [Pirellulales bacterium]|nr:YbhB/YbcL family Raf kinase inhibitor-like protein [Pirellulales bacterium]
MVDPTNPKFAMALGILLMFGSGCGTREPKRPQGIESQSPNARSMMQLTSSAFKNGEAIERDYTADGRNISPPLAWSGVPEGTESLALICDDPDAPNPQRPAATPWVHWVLYNLPPDQTELPPAIDRSRELESIPGARQGQNSWPGDNIGYLGPEPPPKSGLHRYFFKLYALDTMLDLRAGANKEELLKAMEGHILGEGQLIGVYQR